VEPIPKKGKPTFKARQRRPADIVFTDIVQVERAIAANVKSLADVRRDFAHLVALGLQLTAVMRREYSASTGAKWKSSDFPGWNAVSVLMKELRNADQHESPIRVSIKPVWYFPASQLDPSAPPELALFIASENDFEPDQLTPELSDRFDIWFTPEGGGETVKLQHFACDFRFTVKATTPKTAALLAATGTDDLKRLAKRYVSTLKRYRTYYNKQLKAARRGAG
jgi:hypothetical protein